MLQVFLSGSDSALAQLRCELRGRVVHEISVLPKHVSPAGVLLLLLLLLRLRLVRAAIVALAYWWRWGSELGDRRDVLRNGVVKGRRLPVCCWPLHRAQGGGGMVVFFWSGGKLLRNVLDGLIFAGRSRSAVVVVGRGGKRSTWKLRQGVGDVFCWRFPNAVISRSSSQDSHAAVG